MHTSETMYDVAEFKINVARMGEENKNKEEAIVMLHGSDQRETWKVWEPLAPLGEKYPLIIPDLIGYGKSSKTPETPTYDVQARVVLELMDRLQVEKASFLGSSWGGQVALEAALSRPRSVKNLILLASTYDVRQIPRLHEMRIPTLILWAEDDMITQTKAAYLLRDAIGTSRVEILEPVAKDPRHDFTIAHKLERYRSNQVLQKILRFLAGPPDRLIAEPPDLEAELKGLALKEADREKKKKKKKEGTDS